MEPKITRSVGHTAILLLLKKENAVRSTEWPDFSDVRMCEQKSELQSQGNRKYKLSFYEELALSRFRTTLGPEVAGLLPPGLIFTPFLLLFLRK